MWRVNIVFDSFVERVATVPSAGGAMAVERSCRDGLFVFEILD